ncbi:MULTISPECIES: YbjN domain-containing protein [unclassified Sphingomonas]|uniref:YbjN domain-containing protein n=1 Tax=unclassified Sphingomonas TaxID=196159 RepID=UPI0022B4EB99|nr:YbjN domain-containing protein [Sphingomonas sp. NIBR02145]WHU03691.1 YbjN domain-containing protein [Sphingomonas sp. NIBR02145]
MRNLMIAAAVLAGGWTMPVAAQTAGQPPCAKDLVCANAPQTVLAAMEKAGFKPKMSADRDGDPMIEGQGVFRFNVFFYGCDKQHVNCDSLRFEALFAKAPENTPAFANKWNAGKRFLQASVHADGQLGFAYDVAMVGGLNQRNFSDVLAWWTNQLEEVRDFFKAELNPPAAPKK